MPGGVCRRGLEIEVIAVRAFPPDDAWFKAFLGFEADNDEGLGTSLAYTGRLMARDGEASLSLSAFR